MELYEKTIDSKEVYKGKILDLVLETVELPDGQQARREIVRHLPGVGVLPVDGDEMIFVRQFRAGLKQTLVEIPAGLAEAGEEPWETAQRELAEEIGLRPTKLTLLGEMYCSPGFTDEMTTIFLAREYVAEDLEQDADEFIEILRWPIPEVKEKYAQGFFKDAKTVYALGRFFANLI